MTEGFRITPCTTVEELSDQFATSDTVRWVQHVGNSLYLRASGGRKLTEVVVALAWVQHTDVFPGWYRCDLYGSPRRLVVDHVALLSWARQRAIGPVGVIVPGTTSDPGGGIKVSWMGDFIWFYNEADAVDFRLNYDAAVI